MVSIPKQNASKLAWNCVWGEWSISTRMAKRPQVCGFLKRTHIAFSLLLFDPKNVWFELWLFSVGRWIRSASISLHKCFLHTRQNCIKCFIWHFSTCTVCIFFNFFLEQFRFLPFCIMYLNSTCYFMSHVVPSCVSRQPLALWLMFLVNVSRAWVVLVGGQK